MNIPDRYIGPNLKRLRDQNAALESELAASRAQVATLREAMREIDRHLCGRVMESTPAMAAYRIARAALAATAAEPEGGER